VNNFSRRTTVRPLHTFFQYHHSSAILKICMKMIEKRAISSKRKGNSFSWYKITIFLVNARKYFSKDHELSTSGYLIR
jgi:hypothetical protein